MPYFPYYIQYITEIDSIDVIATYLFIQQFFIILTFQSQISLCTENSYITILQPDLQPKIYLVSGLWSYLVAKTDFQCTIDFPPVDLYLNFEIPSLKNPVWQTWFFVYFELDFYCLCSLQNSSSK